MTADAFALTLAAHEDSCLAERAKTLEPRIFRPPVTFFTGTVAVSRREGQFSRF